MAIHTGLFKKQLGVVLSLLFLVVAFGTYKFTNEWLNGTNKLRQPQVKATEDVTITASINACLLDLIVRPEKRIPATGNWSTTLDVKILQNDVERANFQSTTDANGHTSVNLCNLGFNNIIGGNYVLKVKGTSHLYKTLTANNTFNLYSTTLHFTNSNQVLLAGETSNTFDNKINSLDVATQVKQMYSNDDKNDLNQDTKVNSLDIATTAANLFKTGD